MKSNRNHPKQSGLLNKVHGCHRKAIKYVRDAELNFALLNCQSLKFKLDSLATNFEVNKNAFILTNETWFKKKDAQLKSHLERLEDRDDIYCIRKDRKPKNGVAHGGVAFFFDKSKCDFKRLPLNALRGSEAR